MQAGRDHRPVALAAPRPRTPAFLRGVVIVVPTRNRARLAECAVDSALGQQAPNVHVLVSDNSTEPHERDRLAAYCSALKTDAVTYVAPPAPLSMSAHWQWALERAFELDATHYAYLTDRTVFKPGGLAPVLSAGASHPDRVIAYNHDMVDDWADPVRLHLNEWSGGLLELDSSEVLDLCSRAVVGNYLPRMLNCLVPRPVLDRVADRCSTVFDSISPDFCFAFRCLATTDSFLYYDRSILVHHAVYRSQGWSYSRGIESADTLDFGSELGGVQRHFAAPIPELHGTINAIMHEYCYVRNELGPARLRAVDRARYLSSVGIELAQVENEAIRSSMRSTLVAAGWRPPGRYTRLRAFIARQRTTPLNVARRLTKRLVVRTSARLFGSRATAPFWSRLARRSLPIPAPGVTRFASPTEALEFASRYSRRPSREPVELEHVLDCPRTRIVASRRDIGA